MSHASPSSETIFGKAIEIAEASHRAAYIARACGANAALRGEVELLVADYLRAGDFLQRPAVVVETCPLPPATEHIGSVIGCYKLRELLGEGGMGQVFVAEQDQPIRRKIALKIIKPGMDSRDVLGRFDAERQALALMDHPNIAKALDAGMTESGRPYFVMELVRGVPITEFCEQRKLTIPDRLALFIEVCRAIQHAHQKGIIHRDIKPSNVLVTLHDDKAVPKVIDFGVAKATSQRLTEHSVYTAFAQMVGTPLYMSPEQAEMNALDVDTRSDVYSLGVLLYELITGTTPFDRERLKSVSFDEMRRIIREEEPETVSTRLAKTSRVGSPKLPLPLGKGGPRPGGGGTSSAAASRPEPRIPRLSELDWIVAKSLEKDRTRRYESPSAFAADVQRYLDDEPVLACPPSTLYRLQKFARRHKAAAAASLAATAFVALLIVFGIMESALARTAQLARQAAEDETAKKRVALNEAQTANYALKQHLYRADTDLAYQAWTAGLADRTTELLERHRPQPGEVDIRGFEWFHLWQRSHDYLWNLRDKDVFSARIVFSQSSSQLAITKNVPRGSVSGIKETVSMHYIRWRKGKRVDQFGRPIENYQRPTFPKPLPPERDTIIRIFDSRRGSLQKTLTYPSASIGDAVFSHDDTLIAFRTSEGLIAIEAVTGDVRAKRLQEIDDRDADPRPLAASSTKPWIATSLDDENVALLDVNSLEIIRSWPAKKISRLVFSPDGTLIAGASLNDQIVLWETGTGTLKQTIRVEREPRIDGSPYVFNDLITFSPDGKVLAFAEGGNSPLQIALWDIPGNSRRKVDIKVVGKNAPLFQRIQTIHFAQNNLVGASCADRILRYWDTNTGNLVRETTRPGSLAASRDGKLLAHLLGEELQVYAPDVPSYRQVSGKRADIYCALQPATNVLWTWQPSTGPQSNTPVRSWRASTRQPIASFPSLGDVLSGAHRLTISADGKIAAIAADETFSVFSGDKFAERRTFDAKVQSFECIAISPDKRLIATGGSQRLELGHGGNITLWNAQTLKPLFHMDQPWARHPTDTGSRTVNVNEGYPEITRILFSPDGKQLATTGKLKGVSVWNVQTGELQHEIQLQHGSDALAFAPDGNLLAAVQDRAPERHTIKLCDPHRGEIVASMIGHTSMIDCLAFSHDGITLASAGEDGIRFWNVATRERVGILEGVQTKFTTLCFSGDGKTLVAADRLGCLHFWHTPQDERKALVPAKP